MDAIVRCTVHTQAIEKQTENMGEKKKVLGKSLCGQRLPAYC